VVGSQIGGGTGNKVAIGAGVLAGGFFGNKVGKSMDCQDQQYHYDATQNALETQKVGQSSTWNNPGTGHSGNVTPTRTYTSAGHLVVILPKQFIFMVERKKLKEQLVDRTMEVGSQ